MDLPLYEAFLAAFLVLLLLALAGYFGRRQLQTLRAWRGAGEMSTEDRYYSYRQAWRRLLGCALMVVLAGLLGGWYLSGLDHETRHLSTERDVAAGQADPAPLNAEQKRSVNQYVWYWIVATLVVLGMLILAIIDLMAIRRYGIRHLRKIQTERRAMIEQELSAYRSQRNGHG